MAKKESEGITWTRMPKESAKAYEAFTLYRDMGKERTIPKVAEACGKSVSLMNRWSQTYSWVKRVAAYDDEVDRQAAAEHIRDIAKTRARQRKQAVKMQLKGVELLQAIQVGDAKLSEIVSLMKLGMEQERICMGDVGEVVEERKSEATASPVTFYIPDNGRDPKEEEE